LITETEQLLLDQGFDLVDEYSKAVELAQLDSSKPVLDIATGSGRMASVLAGKGYEVWSGDINEEALQKARLRLGDLVSKVQLFTFDAVRTPFASNSFSAITCANAIHEIEDPDAVVREMTRLVSDDGKLLIIEFNDLGFDLMAQIREQLNRGQHRRGDMPTEQIDLRLRALFEHVTVSDIGMNHIWIASCKKKESA